MASALIQTKIICKNPALRRELDAIMINGVGGFWFDTNLSADTRPDLVILEVFSPSGVEDVRRLRAKWPSAVILAVVTDDSVTGTGALRSAGADEGLKFDDLRAPLGRRLLERLLELKHLRSLEENLQASEERFRGIIENAHDLVMLLDETGSLIYTSPSFYRLLGYEVWEILGQGLISFVHPDDHDEVRDRLSDIASLSSETAGHSLQFRFRHNNGRWRYLEAIASNLLNNEAVQAVVMNARDITQQKKTEEELDSYQHHLEELVVKRTEEAVEALSKEKELLEQQRAFVAMVSHEFRTPLTIIDGNAQIIVSRGADIGKEALEKRALNIRSSVERLVQLIERILSSNMLETGKMTLQREACDLEVLIRAVCAEQGEVARSHKITVDVEGLPDNILLDPRLTRQIVTNLVSNAIKYSVTNPVVDVSARRDGDSVVLKVADKGVGIPRAELPRMFQRFFRASTSSGIAGTGLGLSLVKQFVEMQQGSISLESDTGQGAIFTVTLPIVQAETESSLKISKG